MEKNFDINGEDFSRPQREYLAPQPTQIEFEQMEKDLRKMKLTKLYEADLAMIDRCKLELEKTRKARIFEYEQQLIRERL